MDKCRNVSYSYIAVLLDRPMVTQGAKVEAPGMQNNSFETKSDNIRLQNLSYL